MIKGGKVGWRSPSNIALIKYWGKHGVQLPSNPSLSLTLDQSFTETTVAFERKASNDGNVSLDFYFEGRHEEKFVGRIKDYFSILQPKYNWVSQYHFTIESSNSFPHSAGIASSASAFSALALCLCSIHEEIEGAPLKDFFMAASEIARLGSGSACRSIYPELAVWGNTSAVTGSSDLYAVKMHGNIHPSMKSIQDAILIISSEEKSVSSSAGHALMQNHPFAEVRFEQARDNLTKLLDHLGTGDFEQAGLLIEMEAMQLHALMMCSNPNYILIQPNTIRAIQKIKAYRRIAKVPVYFTLDAGPNLHLLYLEQDTRVVKEFIEQELSDLCVDGKWIDDRVGSGPQKIFS